MIKVAFVVGEHSGDRIGADLIRGLRSRLGNDLSVTGLAGDAMAAEGLTSLFNIDELSIIGAGAIVARLPQLLWRLDQTTRHILREEPDVLVVIDSFSFSHRIARRVRKARPGLPIVNYVPPAVWAYRPERAADMTAYIDRAISAFPFEPAVYRALGGPPSTYVGHPLMGDPKLATIRAALDAAPVLRQPGTPPKLLILPGSRRGEVARLGRDFGRTFAVLSERIPGLEGVLPAVSRLRGRIEAEVATWTVKPTIVHGDDAKWEAFATSDAALAASGTVSLELALAGVPMALAYRLDPLAYRLRHLISGWTAALPNYIVDHALVPEHFHEFVRPALLARKLERLLTDTPERHAQLQGFADIRRKMAVDRPPGEAAAEIVIDAARNRRS
ncbi:lipid-A-disaccharide synthase [Aureimonas sp. Leaf454]|uniref:lipid-A-disaccharide synthase n=1 Tax=Aureimonas sp. Leaf454 TaxID=1736381 RepID=UPI0006FF97C4|nr:lipid-A-disaccharide synthase [Aureimonas sp. Leaf454]KQT48716.1 lipid-A-disaccharide synthase [Aureimonas sp. Leaf454]